ncbi:MAG: DMT family transporter [Yoonia sp.]|nr:DMT family transporter [Yoonia sp.]MDG1863966.1 DMT family transporter [Yoonia sp.]
MDLWIPITVGAAMAQTIRFMLQKQLKSTKLSTAGATFARFIYSAPLVMVVAIIYARSTGQGAPDIPLAFWSYAVLGGTTQIIGTACVVALFSHRNFAVGITFKKTEVLLSAFIGFALLGDLISLPALFAIIIGLFGVLLLSDLPSIAGRFHQRIWNKGTALGLASGLAFGFSGNGYRGASLSLGAGDVFYRAIVTLAFVTVFQTAIMAVWLIWRERGEISRVLGAWRVASLVGLSSMAGSICWFTAFTLQTVAYVNALGQIELLFSLLVGAFIFGEKVSPREWQGLLLLTGSIVLLVLAG